MAQVAMQIAGRVYRVACDEGEEPHLEGLARMVNGKIAGMREKFGEMGDQRLTIMAAVTLADELHESQRRISELEARLAQVQEDAASALSGREAWIDKVAETVGEASARIERAAQDMSGARSGED
ncbi:cell division protein ZapA [Methylocella silvestris]|uniref:Cell division protein ZapA n=1 Tax=Methylocella silvestris TaxID=199596 RepID=A0A2J7TG97_METSI|nr:cell division protein ZapA [Methylocella silvestris]PNG25795.1 cell division protein ZapA [Methylocella silvestris]